MNSLQDLNNFALTEIEFEDERASDVVAVVGTAAFNINITEGQSHIVPSNLEVQEIINYQSSSPVFEIDVSTVSGATVTWASVPTGFTVTNPSTGVYRISGLKRPSDWNLIKAAQVNLPSAYFGEFSYTPRLVYNGDDSYSWSVAVVVTEVEALTIPSAFNYINGITQTVTGAATVYDPGSASTDIWAVTVTPSILNPVTTLATQGTGGTVSFNNTTKVLSIGGTLTQVNSHLNSLRLTAAAGLLWNYTLTYQATNTATSETDTKVQQLNNVETNILELTRAEETYRLNTTENITNGPRIAQFTSSIDEQYQMQVYSRTSGAVNTMSVNESSSTFGFTTGPSTEFAPPDGTESGPSNFYQIVLDQSAVTRVTNFYQSVSGQLRFRIFVNYRSGNAWGSNIEITPPDSSTIWLGQKISISADGQRIAIGASRINGKNRLYIYVRSGNAWNIETFITDPSSGTGSSNSQFGTRTALNSTGNRLFLSAPGADASTGFAGTVYVYTRTGSSWALTQTILGPGSQGRDRFGQDVAVNQDGSIIAVSKGLRDSPGGIAVFVYRLNSGTWSLNAAVDTVVPITSLDPLAVDLSNDGNTLLIGNSGYFFNDGQVYVAQGAHFVYAYTGTWKLDHSNSPLGRVSTGYGSINRISISGDGRLVIIGAPTDRANRGSGGPIGRLSVFYKFTTGWQLVALYDEVDFPGTTGIGEGCAISKNGNLLEIGFRSIRRVINANQTVTNYYGSDTLFRNSWTWDNSQKILTILGSKDSVNASVDSMTLTPTTGFTQNFDLIYAATTPANVTVSRLQTVRKI
jgi:hypothetical protein